MIFGQSVTELTCSSKLNQQFGQSGREQQSLSVVWKPADDLLELLGETHFKQPERRESASILTHKGIRVNQSCELKIQRLSHLSASSNTTYSTLCNFRFISVTTCMRRPGVPMILRRRGTANQD